MSLVLYTALYGHKEPLNLQVFGPFTHVRRVLFTDRTDLEFPGVEIIHDPLAGLDPARASRRAKLMPHKYLAEDWSIWLDNKSRLKRDPFQIVAALQAQSGAAFFAFPHFRRRCVYQEGRAVWENGLDDYKTVKNRLDHYRAEGMPENFGLIEGHFIARHHHTPEVAAFGEEWFDHVTRYSRRDQISFPYLAWKRDFQFDYIRDLAWHDTVEFALIDRHHRRPDFPRKHVAYQAARKLWHRLRGR